MNRSDDGAGYVAGPVALGLRVTLGLLAGALLVGCAEGTPEPTPTQPVAEITISARPVQGPAPLAVDFEARVSGSEAHRALDGPPLEDAEDCPVAAWSFDDGDVQLVPGTCQGPTHYQVRHTFADPGSFEVTVRLLGSDVAPGGPVQVLVEGPTATPAPETELGFAPPIVIGTPVADEGLDSDGPPTATLAPPVTEPLATTTAASLGPTAGAAPPRPTLALPASETTFLPADLFVVRAPGAGEAAQLVRIPAAGGAEDVLWDQAEAVAAAASGRLAVTDRLGLWVLEPDGTARRVSDSAQHPIWDPTGRYVAFESDRVLIHDAERNRTRDLGVRGQPLALAPGGSRALIAQGADLLLWDAEDPKALPVAGVQAAAWVDDGTVWLAGEGLRVLYLDDPLSLVTVSAPALDLGAVTSTGSVLRFLLDRGNGPTPHRLDLGAGELTPVPTGPAVPLSDGETAVWAPDGRTLAAFGPGGVALIDSQTGATVQLGSRPALAVSWGPSG